MYLSEEELKKIVVAIAYTVYSFVCPTCQAAKNAKCTIKKRDGSTYIDVPHDQRINLAMLAYLRDYEKKKG
jgi:hypothetical protein